MTVVVSSHRSSLACKNLWMGTVYIARLAIWAMYSLRSQYGRGVYMNTTTLEEMLKLVMDFQARRCE